MPCLVITGANGFIGRHLTQDALARGWFVRALSRNTGWLRTLMPNANLSIHEWNLACPPDQRLLAGAQVLCHLAAGIPPDLNDPACAEACLLNNAVATQRLLEAARQCNLSHFIYYSSGNSYSRQERLACENDPVFPSQQASYYLVSKFAGDVFCEHYRSEYGLQTTTLRLSSVYGPCQVKDIISRFIRQLRSGNPVQLTNGGQHTADFVFVNDVIQATWRVIERSSTGIFNIGSGQSSTILELARLIAEFTGASADLLHVQASSTKPATGFCGLDITKAQTELGYEPTALRDGLRRCAQAAASQP